MAENTFGGCTGNCHSCGESCAPDGERKPGFFEKMEEVSMKMNEIGEENILNILNEAIAEWEKEEEEENKNGSQNENGEEK